MAQKARNLIAEVRKKIDYAAWAGLLVFTLLFAESYASLKSPARTAAGDRTTEGIAAAGTVVTTTGHLALLSSRHYETAGGGYQVVEGEVKNIGETPLAGVRAVVVWYSEQGTMISRDEARTSVGVVIPGQISSFKTISRSHPSMTTYTVRFEKPFGGSIAMRDIRTTQGAAPIERPVE